MDKIVSQFEEQIIVKMRQKFSEFNSIPKSSLLLSQQSLYIVKQTPSFTIEDVCQLLQIAGEPQNYQITTAIQRIYNYFANLLSVLENNEKCRLNWEEGILRGRVQRQAKLNLDLVRNEKAKLLRLTQQCKYGVTCKSQLSDFIKNRKKEIFEEVNTSHITKSIRQLYLLQNYENYAFTTLISQEKYLQQYDIIIQKLLTYHNSLKCYLQRKMPFQELRLKYLNPLKRDYPAIMGQKIAQLIKYTLSFSMNQFNKVTNLVESAHKLRVLLIRSIVKAYYIGFLIKQDIQKLQDTLKNAQEILLNSIKSQQNKIIQQSGINKLNNTPLLNKAQSITNQSFQSLHSPEIMKEITKKIENIQQSFNVIFFYISDENQTVFMRFYQRKLNKRMIRLAKIQDSLTHIQKIYANSDYIQEISFKQEHKSKIQKKNKVIQQKIQELKDLKQGIRSLDQKSFRLLFEEIQRVMLFANEQVGFSLWNPLLASFQRELLIQFMYNNRGERIWKDNSKVLKLSKSNFTQNIVNYNITREDVFQESILQIINKSQSLHSSRLQTQQNFDKYSAAEEGNNYILDLKPDFAQHLLDEDNFKVHFLPKLIRKLQRAYQMTPYSEQPLNLQLARTLQSLKLIPYIVMTQINQKKINLLVYPKFNLSLFIQFKNMLQQHQQTIIKVCSQINNNTIKRNAIQKSIIGFLEYRLRFLVVFLNQIDRLEMIIKTVDYETLILKQSYDISDQITYNFVLKFLLIQKEVKAYNKENQDRINKEPCKNALKLVGELHDNMIKSCRFIFQKEQDIFEPNLLANLLDLCEEARTTMTGNNQFIQQMLRYFQGIQTNKESINILETSQHFSKSFMEIKVIIERITAKIKKFRNITSYSLERQHLKVQEFLIIFTEGSRTTHELFDQNSLKLIKILRTFDF